MSKSFFCAKCGQELLVKVMAVPIKSTIIKVVEPHICSEEITSESMNNFFPKPLPNDIKNQKTSDLDNIFNEFKFVKKLNGLPKPKPENLKSDADPSKEDRLSTVFDSAPLDRRPKEILRTSTAPRSLQSQIKDVANSSPAHSDTELEGE